MAGVDEDAGHTTIRRGLVAGAGFKQQRGDGMMTGRCADSG